MIATVELHAGTTDTAHVFECRPFDIRVERICGSPADRRWFNVLIDAGEGEQRYTAAARAVTRTLHRSVDAGTVIAFRVIDGNQRLTTRRHGGVDEDLEYH